VPLGQQHVDDLAVLIDRPVQIRPPASDLDVRQIAPRPRLAEGSYIAVQIPETRAAWNWQDWAFDPGTGSLVSTSQPDLLLPYNYIVVSISRYHEP
jgi:hypothetical protein